METFEITTTFKNIYTLQTGELICSEVIKQHDTLKDILRNLGVDVDGKQRGKYLKSLSLLNSGMALSEVISQIAGSTNDE